MRSTPAFSVLLALFPLLGSSQSYAAPKIAVYLDTHRIEDTTWFCIAFDIPEKVHYPSLKPLPSSEEEARHRVARIPRMASLDDRLYAIYPVPTQRLKINKKTRMAFVGKIRKVGEVSLRLSYCTERKAKPPGSPLEAIAQSLKPYNRSQARINLDLLRPDHRIRIVNSSPELKNLKTLWAKAQEHHFALLEATTPGVSFFGIARTATGRKYGFETAPLRADLQNVAGTTGHFRLYEMTTGATALTESLASQRTLGKSPQRESRIIPVEQINGITIAEHPWKKMMAGKRPDPEPLADLVPHDHYYVRFDTLDALMQFGELLNKWGTNLMRAYELHSRDFNIRKRYEHQLCLDSKVMQQKLPLGLLQEIAITGSDPYFREGTDVTVLCDTQDPQAFIKFTNRFLSKARREHGEKLIELRWSHQGVKVRSYVTPLREVSLHRVVLDKVVVCSNSKVALRRLIETHLDKRKSIAQSLDFQYMRTVFRKSNPKENGFAFLSDAFIRHLVSPVSKINEKRRLEAMASLHMVTDAALFTQMETGWPAEDLEAILQESHLKREEIAVPGDRGIRWRGKEQVAVSTDYNTIHFTTPLIEVPIRKVTSSERSDYLRFRRDYMRLWRQFFDPVGIRLSLTPKSVNLEAYILPLIQSSGYNSLRSWSSGGTVAADWARLSPSTFFQFLVRIDLFDHDPLSGWLSLHLDDTPFLSRWVAASVRQQMGLKAPIAATDFWKMPIAMAFGVRDGEKFAKMMRNTWETHQFGKGKRQVTRYKGTIITKVQFSKDGYNQMLSILRFAFGGSQLGLLWEMAPRDTPPDALYQAVIGNGYFVSNSRKTIEDLIEQARKRKATHGNNEKPLQVNSAVYISPRGKNVEKALQLYLEWETYRRAVANGPIWNSLYRAGAINDNMSLQKRRAIARAYLGSVPVSPDTLPYKWDSATKQMVHARHGTLGQPKLHSRMNARSPINQLIKQILQAKIALRFREDGIHATLTLDRQK